MAMLSCYSVAENELLVCGKDNRICVWDLDTRKRRRTYVEKHHLSHEYTCMTRHSDKKSKGTLAVGCSDGTVIAWDLTRGVVARVIGETGSSSVPSDLAFSHDGKSLFVASATSSDVSEYVVATGELRKAWKGHKKGVLRLAGNAKAAVLAVGGSSVKLLR